MQNLPHVYGSNVQIYLDIDRNGHNFVPVPELFWKLVYDRLTRQGIVFLGINNHQKVCTKKNTNFDLMYATEHYRGSLDGTGIRLVWAMSTVVMRDSSLQELMLY